MEGVVFAYVLIVIFNSCLGNVEACVPAPEYFLTLEACKARIAEMQQAARADKIPYFDPRCFTDKEFAENDFFYKFEDPEEWHREEYEAEAEKKRREVEEQEAIAARDPFRAPWWKYDHKRGFGLPATGVMR
jgi:hypothetical protein